MGLQTGHSLADAKRLVATGATLLDVRTREEFAERHIPGALNIPVQELGERLAELPKAPVVLYCRSGARSAVATRVLVAAGFNPVIDVGPMTAW